MGKIKKILENELIGGTQSTDVYPVTSTKAVYDTNNKVLDDYIQHLKKTSTFAGIATPTTNPGTPDGPVFYIAGEGTYANFSNIVIEVGQLGILKWNGTWSKEVLEIGADGGNMILDWNTDVATTRKQVPIKNRKVGMQISYKNAAGEWVNEQYIQDNTADVNWVQDKYWVKITDGNDVKKLNLDIDKRFSYYEKCKYSETDDAINYVRELYVEGLDDISIPEEGLRLDVMSSRIVQIWNGGTCLCDFRGTSDMQYIYCKIPAYNNSGVTAYAVVDFTKVIGTKSIYLKNKKAITTISLCPYIKSLFSEEKLDSNISVFQLRYAIKNKISWILSEAYFDGITDQDTPLELRLINQSMTTGLIQLYQGSTCLCDFRKSISEVKGVIQVPEYKKSGVNGYVVINNLLDIQPTSGTKTIILDTKGCTDLSLNPYIASLYNQLKIDEFEKIILEGSFKWKGKNILVIGDSMTADGRWQKKMGELLGANIFTHAMGSITTEVMVDGNGSSFPALNQSDVTDKDAIIIMGFYNDRRLANTNLGTEMDLYPSKSTFIGKLNYAIKRIYEELANANNLKCRVIIASPHRWGVISEEDDGDKWGTKLLEGCQIAGKVNGCPVFNLMDNAGINRYTWDIFARSTSDKLHLNKDGYNRVGEYIAAQMNMI